MEKEHVHLAMTGEDRRTGGGVTSRLSAITGDCRTTGVGSAAMKDTLLDSTVAGNLVKATWKNEVKKRMHQTSEK